LPLRPRATPATPAVTHLRSIGATAAALTFASSSNFTVDGPFLACPAVPFIGEPLSTSRHAEPGSGANKVSAD
jgi:hypothetical protein